MNPGSFNTGDVAYLYVVDANGQISNSGDGFQITVGESGSIGQQPTVLSVPKDFGVKNP